MIFVPEIAQVGTRQRRGVVLLVVMALLALFAAVGLTFVFYADAEATAAQHFRERAANLQPDVDPELLLAYYLGQLIYDADDTNGAYSAMRGHSLARAMYGSNATNNVPYSGIGRAHYTEAKVGGDNYDYVNHSYYPADNFIRDPGRIGFRADNKAAQTNPYVAENVSYTYPDNNNMYLGGVNANGEVVIQSFYRSWTAAKGRYGSLSPDPNWNKDTSGNVTFILPDADGGGHVKNLDFSPGTIYYDVGVKKFYNNDSVWMDLGFGVQTSLDGRKFKPLFAALVVDQDGKLNLNVHGNIRGAGNTHVSSGGFGPWEVNLAAALTKADWINLFTYNSGMSAGPYGRYGKDGAPAAAGSVLPPFLGSRFYSLIDYDGVVNPTYAASRKYLLPGEAVAPAQINDARYPSYFGFPQYNYNTTKATPEADYGDGDVFERTNHPSLYNALSPQSDDRVFDWYHLEALLRYGGKGSPALSSDLFRLCPTNFSDARVRRLVSTHSFDLGRPGATPWLNPNDANYVAYTVGAGSYPTPAAVKFPAGFPGGTGGEFGGDWRGLTAALGRLDLNKTLTDYPPPNAAGRYGVAEQAQYDNALSERKQLAKDIFERLRWVTTGNGPAVALPAKGGADWKALRWLAQLAVNIVDYRDTDEMITPFNWDTTDATDKELWVYGTELPRLVINEAYAEVITDPADPSIGTMKAATLPYKCNFWLELLNPTSGNDFKAPLMIAKDALDPDYAAYKLVVAKAVGNVFTDNNPTYTAEPNNIELEVVDFFTADPLQVPAPINATTGNVLAVGTSKYDGPDASNQGFYLLGPKYDFPGTAAARPKATLRVKDQNPLNNASTYGVNRRNNMFYELPLATTNLAALPKHNLFLRRLLCPYLKPQPVPAQPNYNPYVTVDYVQNVPVQDAVSNDSVKDHTPPKILEARTSVGRNQPYAAHSSQQADQAPDPQNSAQPQHTFFKHNGANVNDPGVTLKLPFDWLVHLDRHVTSPVEILQTSLYPPHELTQQFMTATQNFGHRTPSAWFDPAARIYRLFEFLEVGSRAAGVSTGGRIPGKININTLWGPLVLGSSLDTGDVEIFRALCDFQSSSSSFTANDVKAIFEGLLKSRHAGTAEKQLPGPNDRPFRSFATPFAPVLDTQAPNGSGIDDTFFRVDPNDAAKRLFEIVPAIAPATAHPYARMELLSKIFNNITTRSNVFAVWLTVGFFEVTDDTVQPPKLGREIGRKEGRHVRHRMFTLIDRSELRLFSTPGSAAGPIVPATPPVTVSVSIPDTTVTMANGAKVTLQPKMLLEVDSGSNAETVVVEAVTPGAPGTFTAVFTKPHAASFPIIARGNPGPWPRYNPRLDSLVVPYFSVIE